MSTLVQTLQRQRQKICVKGSVGVYRMHTAHLWAPRANICCSCRLTSRNSSYAKLTSNPPLSWIPEPIFVAPGCSKGQEQLKPATLRSHKRRREVRQVARWLRPWRARLMLKGLAKMPQLFRESWTPFSSWRMNIEKHWFLGSQQVSASVLLAGCWAALSASR